MFKLKTKDYLSNTKNKISLIQIIKKVNLKFNKKYYPENKEDNYLNMIMEMIIFNKNTHLVSIFKDCMIYDFKEEFLKRYYSSEESKDRIPRFVGFYKNYLKFFCKPLFCDFNCNNIIQTHSEKKAEIFYNQNLRSKNDKNAFDDGLYEDNDSNSKISKSKIEKTIFNDVIKQNIEETYLTSYITENSDNTINLQKNDFIKNQTFLYNKNSNEQSLINIINSFNGKTLANNLKISKPKINYYFNNSSNPNNKHSKILSYNSLCTKKKILKENKNNHTKSQIKFKNMKNSRNQYNQNLNNNLYTLTKLDSKINTYDILSPNNHNNNNKNLGFNLFNTQKVENLLNKFKKNIVHKKNINSIDNLLNNKNKKSFINSTTINLNNSKKGKNSINNTSIKNNIKTKKRISSFSKNQMRNLKSPNNKYLNNHHTINNLHYNDDFIKISLASLIINENKNNNSKKHKRNNSNNFNNKKNIKFQEILNSKLKNNKIDIIISNNLKNIINDKSKKLSRNKGRSIDLNNNLNSQNSVYRSLSGLDKKMLTLNTIYSPKRFKDNKNKITSIYNNKLIKSSFKNNIMDVSSKKKIVSNNNKKNN